MQTKVTGQSSVRVEPARNGADPVYLVLESDPFVAEDIVASLHAIGPCRVIRASEEGIVREMLRAESGIEVAFLDVTFARVLQEKLDVLLSAHGARIVLTVGEADRDRAIAQGWGILIRPFSERMIRRALTAAPAA